MKFTKTSVFGLVSVFLLSALSLTCTIGLGDSVDTKAPQVAIAYPPVQSIIRNTFTMNGTASDDVKLLG
ncbi:MAG TPA: hypothetical protein PKH81_08720, partial [Treponemataceae bacterium]|nr:hypothetical protein [Treponemataceae bacterium]